MPVQEDQVRSQIPLSETSSRINLANGLTKELVDQALSNRDQTYIIIDMFTNDSPQFNLDIVHVHLTERSLTNVITIKGTPTYTADTLPDRSVNTMFIAKDPKLTLQAWHKVVNKFYYSGDVDIRETAETLGFIQHGNNYVRLKSIR